jgi:hypothetical protein
MKPLKIKQIIIIVLAGVVLIITILEKCEAKPHIPEETLNPPPSTSYVVSFSGSNVIG